MITTAQRPVIERFARAMTEAIQIYKTEKEWTKGVIGKYLRTNDAGNLERSYNSFRPLFPEVPHPTVDGVKTLLDDLSGKIPEAADAKKSSSANPSLFSKPALQRRRRNDRSLGRSRSDGGALHIQIYISPLARCV
jgi:hypothetical protein